MGSRPSAGSRARVARLPLLLAVVVGLALSLGRGPATEPLTVQPTLSVLDIITTPIYKVRTTLQQPNGSVVTRTTTGILAVPTLVDVHQPAILGLVGLPDLVVTILPRLPLGVGLRIDRFIGAPLLPVKVEVELSLPTQANNGVAFGYDARETRSPASFDADLQLGIAPGLTDLGLTVKTTDAPPALDLLASLYTRGTGSGAGTRVDPLDLVLGATPVPSPLTATARLTPGLLAFADANDREVKAHVAAPAPFHADAHVDKVEGDDITSLDADVPQLPASVDALLHQVKDTEVTEVTLDTPAGIAGAHADVSIIEDAGPATTAAVDVTGVPSHVEVGIDNSKLLGDDATVLDDDVERTTVTWGANAPLTRATVVADGHNSRNVPFHLEGAIDQLPGSPANGDPGLTVDIDKVGPAPAVGAIDERALVVEAGTPENGAPIGTVDAAFALAGAPLPRLDTTAPAYGSVVTTDAGLSAVAARIHGVSYAKLDTQDPITVDVTTTHAQAFDFAFDSPKVDVTANVRNLPATAHVTIDTPTKTAAGEPETSEPEVTALGYLGSATIEDIDAIVDAITGSGTTAHAVVHVDDTPTELDVTLTAGPGDHHKVVVDGNGPIGHIDADATTKNADGQDVVITAELDELPPDMTVEFDKVGPAPAPGAVDDRPLVVDARTGLDTDTDDPTVPELTIGSIEATLAIGDATPEVKDLPAYAVLDDDGTNLAVAAALTDLTRMRIETGDPLDLEVALANPLLLDLDVTTPTLSVIGTIDELSTLTTLVLDTPDDGCETDICSTIVDYTGTAQVQKVDVDLVTTPVSGAPFDGHVTLTGVPTDVVVTLRDGADDHHKVVVDGNGGIGHVDVNGTTRNAEGQDVVITANIDDLPPDLTVDFDKIGPAPEPGAVDDRPLRVDARTGLDTDTDDPTVPELTIGSIEATLAIGDATPEVKDLPAYAVLNDDGTNLAVAAAITELTRLRLQTGDPLDLEAAVAQPLLLDVDVTTPTLSVIGTVDQLSTLTTLSLDTPDDDCETATCTTTVDYTGTSEVQKVDVAIVATPDSGAKFDGHVILDGVPTAATVTLTDIDAEDKLTADYLGGAIDRIRVLEATFDPAGIAPPIGLTADLTDVPTSGTLIVDGREVEPGELDELPEGASRQEITWTAAAPTGRLIATADLLDPTGKRVLATVDLDQLPASMTATIDKAGVRPAADVVDDRQVVIEVSTPPGSRIGAADVGLSIDGAAFPAVSTEPHATIVAQGTQLAVGAHVTGLTQVLVDTRDPLVLEATLDAPLLFELAVTTDDLTIDQGTFTNLSTFSHVELDRPDEGDLTKTTVLRYHGDAPIGLIQLHAVAPLAGGGTLDADVDLAGVPTDATVTIVKGILGTQEIHYLGGQLGSIDALVTLTPAAGSEAGPTIIDAFLSGLPTQVDIVTAAIRVNFTRRTDIDYDANGPLGLLDVELTTDENVVHAVLTDLPTQVDVHHRIFGKPQPSDPDKPRLLEPFSLDITGNSGIATTEITVTEAGATPITEPADSIPAALHHVDGSTFARVPGIQAAHLRSAEPLEVGLTLDQAIAPTLLLDIFVQIGSLTVDGTIDSLPYDTDIVVDMPGGDITYTASNPIAHIDLVAEAPPGELLGNDDDADLNDPDNEADDEYSPLDKLGYVEVHLDDLPPGVAVGFGTLDDGSEGVDVRAFQPAPDDNGDDGGDGISDLLPPDFGLHLPDFDRFPDLLPPPTIGSFLLLAGADENDAKLAHPKAGLVFEDRVNGTVRLAIAVERLQQAGFSRLEEPSIVPGADRKLTTLVHLQVANRSEFGNVETAQDDEFEMKLDLPITDGVGNLIPDCQRFTHIFLRDDVGETPVNVALPNRTDVELVTDEVGGGLVSNCDDVLPTAVKSVSEVTVAPTPPGELSVEGFRYTGNFLDSEHNGNRADFLTLKASVVPTFLSACSGTLNNLCTGMPADTTVNGTPIHIGGRPGASTGIHTIGPLVIDRFEACELECVSGFSSEPNPLEDDSIRVHQFKKFRGVFIDTLPGLPGMLEVESHTPDTRNNDGDPVVDNTGVVYFNTGGGEVTIDAGEIQTRVVDPECPNNTEPTRTGMGAFSKSNTDPLKFWAQQKLLLFRVTSRRCSPLGIDCKESYNTMVIHTGEIVPNTLKAAGLASLNQELTDNNGC